MRRLLIVVDMQNDFVDGALGFEAAKDIIPGIADRIREYKAAGDEVVFTLDTHSENYLETMEGKNLPVVHCIKGTKGHELVPELQELTSDCVIFEKPTFGSMELAKYIGKIRDELTSIEVCGLVSNICVISNTVLAKAAAPEVEIIVDSGLTSCFDPKLTEAALDICRSIHVKVL
ncbi:Nicotinamidase-related amidase [Ruminococcaceae bacterium YRB3002]|nr:Nicotinamidase-related amidase [Ruminococcaceae bacterium YRB3002]